MCKGVSKLVSQRIDFSGAEQANRFCTMSGERSVIGLLVDPHLLPNAADEPRANGEAVCSSGDRRERTPSAC
jgi:hypothetical protein